MCTYITNIIAAMLGFDLDVIPFNQRCSLDGGRIFIFTVNSSFDNADECIPLNGPWKEECKRCVWHRCIFRSCLNEDILKTF